MYKWILPSGFIQYNWDGPRGHKIIISKKYCICVSLKINFLLANSADPDEMPHHAAFHLGPHCLPKYLSRGFRSPKD